MPTAPGTPLDRDTIPIALSLDILIQVEMFDFLLDDPIGHWVDVESDNITAESVGLYEWSAATHEWIGNLDSF